MKFKLVILKLSVFMVVIGLSCIGKPTKAVEKKNIKQPNIIFVFADDMGFGDLGCYGNTVIKTPNLDKMASEGMLFTNFTTSSPVCSPSRVAIMSGQYPVRHQIHYALSHDKHNQDYKMPNCLDPKAEMLPRLLQTGGYKTAHFGKWHLGGTKDSPSPHDYGIDEVKIDTGTILDESELCYKGVNQADKTKTVMDITIDFVERHQDKPFFINCWICDPHALLEPSPEQLADYPELESKAKGFTSAPQVYNAVITDIDRHVGRLLDKLDELGLSENTLVVFSSDNGPAPIWAGGTKHSGTGEVGPLRGCKSSLYEGGIRVPFIAWWPGRVPAGTIDNETIISGVDLLPTFCSFAGVEIQNKLKPDGQDMSAALLGTPTQRNNPLMWEFRYSPWGRLLQNSPVLAMRDGDWKLMMNPDGSRIELYNLKKNLCEVDNLASENKKIVKRMRKQLLEWHNSLPNIGTISETPNTLNYPGRWKNIFDSNK
jgi:N-acetylgalactosamine-6-sulfatase